MDEKEAWKLKGADTPGSQLELEWVYVYSTM